jgi:hypothetical protein
MANSVSINPAVCADKRACVTRAGSNEVVELRLNPREVRRIEVRGAGTQVLCAGVALWLTQERDPEDHILYTGERFTVTVSGCVVAQGLPSPRY